MHLQDLLLFVPVLLFSVIAHEYAHGYAALKQGDTTALDLGRLTWNPIKHIDPFMTLLLPGALYWMSHGTMMLGGAKPVPVDPRNYRDYKRGDIIVSLAGVFVNLLIALASVVLFVLFGLIGQLIPAAGSTIGIIQAMLDIAVGLNLLLLAFNLIPIPPLDGSHVMKYLLPLSWAIKYQQFGRYGLLVLIALLWFGNGALSVWFSPALIVGQKLMTWVHPFAVPAFSQWVS